MRLSLQPHFVPNPDSRLEWFMHDEGDLEGSLPLRSIASIEIGETPQDTHHGTSPRHKPAYLTIVQSYLLFRSSP